MTSDEDLILALEQLGIIVRSGYSDTVYDLVGDEDDYLPMSKKEVLEDWRVAGVLMERAHMVFIERHGNWQVRYDKAYGDRSREWYSDSSQPRAIIRAGCIELLDNRTGDAIIKADAPDTG